ncbi:formylglycine-generating enzyme family protein [Actinotalea sp. K2]|nr:formylglycine-generating enzyme family protein [Actinotalea sp. K2]
MGNDSDEAILGDGEGPVRPVDVAPFAMSVCAVTAAQFARFVAETGYRTVAEELGASFVFASLLPRNLRDLSTRPPHTPWWCAVPGATWRLPEGPGSDVDDRQDHPVVHVAWRDARAFARWAGGRLPTEAEWEYAARGGLEQATYPWGDDLQPGGEHRCNIWQGRFPTENTADDGYIASAPVRTYPPNGYGLFEVAGNVWEMVDDVWRTPGATATGRGTSRRVLRGGSYLCHESYCNRYRVAARTSSEETGTSGNQGFRVAFDAGTGDAPQ